MSFLSPFVALRESLWPSPVVLPEAPAIIRATEWKPFDGPLDRLPRNRREIYAMFGNPGVGSPDKAWVKTNIIEVRDLPGVPRRWYVKLHRLAEPYWREGLRRAHIAAPEYEITRFGGYVFRHIRHDPSRPLSYHSWGIAGDQNPGTNQVEYFTAKRPAPEAWSPEYMKDWPRGVPKAFVEAMASVGFAWGSDWDEDGRTDDHTFLDPMHFELVRRGGAEHAV
jgi:hypothetical protein